MTENQKLLVIGWDGATWDYIDPMLEAGELPHLAALLQRGARATLRSTVPPYTNVAWPSLTTGLLPDKTGIFDGARTRKGSYERIPTNLITHRGVSIWQWLNRFGYSSGVLNVPMTYPAQPIGGYMVSGFDSPNSSTRVAYPPNILQEWAKADHPYHILSREIELMNGQNPHQSRGPLEQFVQGWVEITEEQGKFVSWLLNTYPVDNMFVVFTGTDSINHRTRQFDEIVRVYRAADRALGYILNTIDEDVYVTLVSDHGSTPAYNYISLYKLLYDAGWLRFRSEIANRFWERLPFSIGSPIRKLMSHLSANVRRAIETPLLHLDGRLCVAYDNIDWGNTKVYAGSGLGPLYINLEGREPQGTVAPDAYETLRDEVIEVFSNAMTRAGHRLFRNIRRCKEIYPDAREKDNPPDLIFEPERWSDHVITGYPSDPLIRPISEQCEYGTHTPDGIFVLAGPNCHSNAILEPMQIVDVVPTILAAVDVPIPETVDGAVQEHAFREPPQVSWEPADTIVNNRPVEDQHAAEVLRRLQALGYLE